jgi:multidrug efflux pump subunit AcrA (membrane-fusion protein)
MRCTVTIVLEEVRDAVLVPSGAVSKRPEGAFVKAGKSAQGPFEERRVILGPADDKNVVIREGVQPGEFVEVTPAEGGPKK